MNIKQVVVKLLKEYVIQEKIKDEFQVLPTTKQEIEPFIKKHYIGAWPTGIKRIYGIYRKVETGRQVIGMVIYGVPFYTVPKFLEPEIKLNETLELKRLFIEDIGVKNLESFAIGQSLKLLKNDEPSIKIVFTFADDLEGHKGTVYQATNAIYLGTYGMGKHKYIYILRGDINGIKAKIQHMIKQYPKQQTWNKDGTRIQEASYYNDVGHDSQNAKHKLWFWSQGGNLIVKPASRGGHLTYPQHDRADYEGRFDCNTKRVSIVDLAHYNHVDTEFGYDSSNDLSQIPQELIQLLKFEFGDDIKMTIFMEESIS